MGNGFEVRIKNMLPQNKLPLSETRKPAKFYHVVFVIYVEKGVIENLIYIYKIPKKILPYLNLDFKPLLLIVYDGLALCL